MYPCVNMQILFMHCLQGLHQETLQTFGATFICSVLGLRRKERKAKNYRVLSSAWAYVWMAGLQEDMYTFVYVFTFAEGSPSPRRKVSNFHTSNKTEQLLWVIISLLFMSPKDEIYLHAGLCFFRVYFLHWTWQVRLSIVSLLRSFTAWFK